MYVQYLVNILYYINIFIYLLNINSLLHRINVYEYEIYVT